MSHRTHFPPPSPALSPSLYSGMSSLQINQASPGPVAGSSYHPSTSQHQKALLKGPKAARYQNRRSEHPSALTPWKDPREAAAASAGRKRSLKDDVLFRQDQIPWVPVPRDARPTTREEGTVVVRTMIDHIREQEARAPFFSEAERRVAVLEEMFADSKQHRREFSQTLLEEVRDIEPVLLQMLQMSPNEEFREFCQKKLDNYYKVRRDMEMRRGL